MHITKIITICLIHKKIMISVKSGDKFKIEVESNPSTGYKWEILSFDQIY
jgi:predicted secreted protein